MCNPTCIFLLLNTGDLSEHLPQGYSGWTRAAASTGVAQSQSGLVHLLCSGAHLCFLPCPGRNLGLVPNPVRSHSRDKSFTSGGLASWGITSPLHHRVGGLHVERCPWGVVSQFCWGQLMFTPLLHTHTCLQVPGGQQPAGAGLRNGLCSQTGGNAQGRLLKSGASLPLHWDLISGG